MQPVIRELYRTRIFPRYPPPGKRILEVGALADPSQCLLSFFALEGEGYELTGIDMGTEEDQTHRLGYKLLRVNANDMDCFDKASFDAVICHGVLNNDAYFWRSLHQMRTVLRVGGLLYIMVPGFEKGLKRLRVKRFLYWMGAKLRKLDLEKRCIYLAENTFLSAVATYHYSPTPKDYYRFSETAVKEVLLEGFDVLHYEEVLYPPRLIAVGKKF